jgi:hypothetical protein
MNHQTYHEDPLAEVFDVEPIPVTTVTVSESNAFPIVESDVSPEAARDFEYVRQNLYGLIEKGSDAVDKALDVATESQHPRAFEVAGNLIKNIADLTDKLVALQKTKAAIEVATGKSSSITEVNVDKAVFIGSTAELLKALKKHDAQ